MAKHEEKDEARRGSFGPEVTTMESNGFALQQDLTDGISLRVPPSRSVSKSDDCRFTIIANLFPTAYKNLRIEKAASSASPCMASSSSHLVHPTEATGSFRGSFGAISLLDVEDLAGKWVTVVQAHEAALTSLQLSPFYPTICASASEGGDVCIWELPKHGASKTRTLRDPLMSMTPLPRAVATQSELATTRRRSSRFPFTAPSKSHGGFRIRCSFNPVVDWILGIAASSAADGSMHFWDLEAEKEYHVAEAGCVTREIFWNANGSFMCSVSDTNVVQMYDPRTPKVAYRRDFSLGQTGFEIDACLMDGQAGNSNYLITTGSSASGLSVEARLWDIRTSTASALTTTTVLPDVEACRTLVHWDESLGLLYFLPLNSNTVAVWANLIAEVDTLHSATRLETREPVTNFCFLPKVAVDAERNEVGRLFAASSNGLVQPYTFYSPTWPDVDTLFPPVLPSEASISANSWINGGTPWIRRINVAVIEDTFHVTQPSRDPLTQRVSKTKGFSVVSRASAEARIAKLENRVMKLNEEKELLTTQLPTPVTEQSPDAAGRERHRAVMELEKNIAERDEKVSDLEREVERLWSVAQEGAGWHQKKIKELSNTLEEKEKAVETLRKELATAKGGAETEKSTEIVLHSDDPSTSAVARAVEMLAEKENTIQLLREELRSLKDAVPVASCVFESGTPGISESDLFCCGLKKTIE